MKSASLLNRFFTRCAQLAARLAAIDISGAQAQTDLVWDKSAAGEMHWGLFDFSTAHDVVFMGAGEGRERERDATSANSASSPRCIYKCPSMSRRRARWSWMIERCVVQTKSRANSRTN